MAVELPNQLLKIKGLAVELPDQFLKIQARHGAGSAKPYCYKQAVQGKAWAVCFSFTTFQNPTKKKGGGANLDRLGVRYVMGIRSPACVRFSAGIKAR